MTPELFLNTPLGELYPAFRSLRIGRESRETLRLVAYRSAFEYLRFHRTIPPDIIGSKSWDSNGQAEFAAEFLVYFGKATQQGNAHREEVILLKFADLFTAPYPIQPGDNEQQRWNHLRNTLNKCVSQFVATKKQESNKMDDVSHLEGRVFQFLRENDRDYSNTGAGDWRLSCWAPAGKQFHCADYDEVMDRQDSKLLPLLKARRSKTEGLYRDKLVTNADLRAVMTALFAEFPGQSIPFSAICDLLVGKLGLKRTVETSFEEIDDSLLPENLCYNPEDTTDELAPETVTIFRRLVMSLNDKDLKILREMLKPDPGDTLLARAKDASGLAKSAAFQRIQRLRERIQKISCSELDEDNLMAAFNLLCLLVRT